MSGETVAVAAQSVAVVDSLIHLLDRARFGLLRSLPTTAGIAVLVGAGLFGVHHNAVRTRSQLGSQASSLARLSGAMILVQGFRGDPSRNPPSLWTDRLGVDPAKNLWKRYGQSMWWQAWSQDGDAYLVLASANLPSNISALHRERVNTLVVVGSDALHREQLLQRVNPTQPLADPQLLAGSLFGSCLRSLAEAPGVLWTGDALATISGTLAPLLQQGREGCVQLRLQSNQLRWEGVIGNRPLSSATLRASILAGMSAPGGSPEGIAESTLLQIDGARLELILGTLLSRQIIQEPLEEHYGINREMRRTIADRPFALRLQSRDRGLYRAGLQVQLPLLGKQQQWSRILEAVSDRLQSRGFELVTSPKAGSSGTAAETLWHRRDDQDRTVVGGWALIDRETKPVLSIGLGIDPAVESFLASPPQGQSPSLRATADPARLLKLGLLGGQWPKPVENASDLSVMVTPLDGSKGTKDWWRMSGQLELTPES